MSLAKHPILIDLAIILALALVAVIGYKYSPLLLPKADLTVTPEPCDLNKQACRVPLPIGGDVEVEISPRPVPVIRPMTVSVAVTGVQVDKVEIDFAGATMNMGLNRGVLAGSGDGRFRGEATIPVCITGRMTWRATLMIDAGRQRIAVPFLFEAPVEGA